MKHSNAIRSNRPCQNIVPPGLVHRKWVFTTGRLTNLARLLPRRWQRWPLVLLRLCEPAARPPSGFALARIEQCLPLAVAVARTARDGNWFAGVVIKTGHIHRRRRHQRQRDEILHLLDRVSAAEVKSV